MRSLQQIDAVSVMGLISAALILMALATLATAPHLASSLTKIDEEPFASAMRGESNGETGRDNASAPRTAVDDI